MNVCMLSMVNTPYPSSISKERRARETTVTPRRISRTYTASSSMPKICPSCSQTTAKMKSL